MFKWAHNVVTNSRWEQKIDGGKSQTSRMAFIVLSRVYMELFRSTMPMEIIHLSTSRRKDGQAGRFRGGGEYDM